MELKCEKLIDYPSGAKRDTTKGKGRYGLISPIMLRRLALLYERGAEQKGDRNWEKGFPFSRALDSAQRHINQYREGHRDEDHPIQAIWNLACVVHFEEMIELGLLPKELNDLPVYTKRIECKVIEPGVKEYKDEKDLP